MPTSTGNNLRYVDPVKIHAKLEEYIFKSFPGFHAIKECDYDPAFCSKGRSRPCTILTKQKNIKKVSSNSLTELSENNDELKSTFNAM